MSFDARVDVTPEVAQEDTPQVLTVSQILNDLENGIDRAAMRKKYNLTMAEIKHIFTHPKLQGVRVKKQKVMRVQLIDDTVDTNQTSIPVEQEKVNELRDEASTRLVEALNPNFAQPTDSNFYNNNQTEIQD